MPVGTSLGAYYDDSFHAETARWDDKYDTNDVAFRTTRVPKKKKILAAPDEMEMITEEEGKPQNHLTRDRNVMSPDTYMKGKHPDRNFIYNDSGQIVDYSVPEQRQDLYDRQKPSFEDRWTGEDFMPDIYPPAPESQFLHAPGTNPDLDPAVQPPYSNPMFNPS